MSQREPARVARSVPKKLDASVDSLVLGQGTERPRRRLTLRRVMLAVAALALALGIFMAVARWFVYPHVKLTIVNESSAAICDVRIDFLYGERTAKRIEPGVVAESEIRSGGSAGVYISYRDARGIFRRNHCLYYSGEHGSEDRGFLEVHIPDGGIRLVDGVYTAVDFPIWTIRVPPTGRLIVR